MGQLHVGLPAWVVWVVWQSVLVPITRQELIEGLNRLNPADEVCREALAAGAGFQVWDGMTPLLDLIAIYEHRVVRLRSKGIATVGADTLVGRLAALEDKCVRVGTVHSEALNFTVFLSCDRPVALASFGVAASAANPDWDWSNLDWK